MNTQSDITSRGMDQPSATSSRATTRDAGARVTGSALFSIIALCLLTACGGDDDSTNGPNGSRRRCPLRLLRVSLYL